MLAEPFDVPGNGRMTVATDPAGAAFGVWQAAGTIGAEIYDEPGGLTWTDARLTDPEAARAFYAAVFGYHYQALPGAPGDYLTFHLGEAPLGGMGGMMDPAAVLAVPLGGLLLGRRHRRRGRGGHRRRRDVAGNTDGHPVRADGVPHRPGRRGLRPRRTTTGRLAPHQHLPSGAARPDPSIPIKDRDLLALLMSNAPYVCRPGPSLADREWRLAWRACRPATTISGPLRFIWSPGGPRSHRVVDDACVVGDRFTGNGSRPATLIMIGIRGFEFERANVPFRPLGVAGCTARWRCGTRCRPRCR